MGTQKGHNLLSHFLFSKRFRKCLFFYLHFTWLCGSWNYQRILKKISTKIVNRIYSKQNWIWIAVEKSNRLLNIKHIGFKPYFTEETRNKMKTNRKIQHFGRWPKLLWNPGVLRWCNMMKQCIAISCNMMQSSARWWNMMEYWERAVSSDRMHALRASDPESSLGRRLPYLCSHLPNVQTFFSQRCYQ